jgi:hypothetical protein
MLKEYMCEKCNKSFYFQKLNPQNIHCPHCIFKSKYEYDIKEWLEQELQIQYIKTNKSFSVQNNPNRTTHELDLWFPDYNIGIEFHGLYWHSDINKTKEKDDAKNKASLNVESTNLE